MAFRPVRLTVQQANAGNELAGTPAQRWEDYPACPAVMGRIEPLSARERIHAQSVESNVTHNIETEFFQGASPTMRLCVADETLGPNQQEPERVFNVEGVTDPDERHRKLLWRCIEVN